MNKKRIFLIGDSIRQGYDFAVAEALKEVADVYYPEENCRFAQYTLRRLHEWKEKYKLEDIDCVHWNVGLWDSLELFNDDVLTPIDFYEHFIDAICRRIKLLFPKAEVIFATSTAVLEHKFPNPDFMKRKNINVIKYNEVAVKKAKQYGFKINDLYELVKDIPESYYSDQVHLYTKEGGELIGKKVIEVIADTLGFPQDKVNYDISYVKNTTDVIGS